MHEEPSGGPTGDYNKPSEVVKLMEDNIKAGFEVGTRCAAMRIVEETIEHIFAMANKKLNEGIKTTVRNILEGALIDIVQQGGPDTIPVREVDKLLKSIRSMEVLTRQVVGSKSNITPITAFFKKYVDRMVEEVCFESALEPQFSKRGMVQISQPRSSSISPKPERRIPAPPEQLA